MATAHNDEWMDNPIFAGRAPILPSAFSEPHEQPKPKKRPVPPAVGRIIGELGLRYRPAASADLEAHAEALRLLCEDVADIPQNLLEVAAKRWVRENKFMPRASELVNLARGQIAEATRGTDYGLQQLQAHCDRLNALNGGRDGWRVVGEAPNRTVAKFGERSDAA